MSVLWAHSNKLMKGRMRNRGDPFTGVRSASISAKGQTCPSAPPLLPSLLHGTPPSYTTPSSSRTFYHGKPVSDSPPNSRLLCQGLAVFATPLCSAMLRAAVTVLASAHLPSPSRHLAMSVTAPSLRSPVNIIVLSLTAPACVDKSALPLSPRLGAACNSALPTEPVSRRAGNVFCDVSLHSSLHFKERSP